MNESGNALIALGGNMPSERGQPAETLRLALDRLDERGCRIRAVSRLYVTPCFPPGAGPDFVNAAAVLDCAGGPEEVLALLHEVEAEFGRERLTRWGERTLDIDLIAMGDAVLPDHDTHRAWRDMAPDEQGARAPGCLILPHPRVQDRGFVLVPLADVAPEWRHPVLGQTVAEMLAALPEEELEGVVPM
ncbi:2-amino-4-hydroxy-6-hydroxymethyldihydropteridinediphosphokinase [Roseovarius litoreus]|uniref:2-amino-4-hydroxy-6-hydroxymethyldihydropteridine pyrophosphokinase n=1 Tax=Roseovarius litoreus TaxID=1155722 RepID=A0A1M7J5F6_9RHOB|nr:2-amino-4-hydroxy-6-hydroxymethyldihydropteridine diphosphokinase [Roseovarius litoreus]SHM48226.1 2-amino-4-hydroxy-6-hydroxymethyldihydropteridinediphosphokinase [Roseovarius litoreus]